MIQLYQTLDLRPIGIPQTLRLSQYDSDFEIIFELTNFDGTWILDTNTTAEVQGTKTDGHGYSADAVFDDQLKTVTIAGDVQMTAAAGRNTFEVVLFHDGDRLGSKNFILDVERAALDAETTASDSKIKNFTEMVEAAEDAAETATAAAEAAEEAAASIIPGMSDEAKEALLACFRNVAWTTDQGQTLYDALEDALYSVKTLVSISAVFEQGSAVIYTDDSLDTLKQYLTVTAYYDDGTSASLTNYTLSGELIEGISNITASYDGKSDSFSVVVTNRIIYSLTPDTTFDGTVSSVIETDVQLFDTDKSYTIVIDATVNDDGNSESGPWTILLCRDGSYGFGLTAEYSKLRQLYFNTHGTKTSYNPDAGEIPGAGQHSIKMAFSHEAGASTYNAQVNLDGHTANEINTTYSYVAGNLPIYIGCNYNRQSGTSEYRLYNFFNGTIHELKVYSYAMTQAECDAYCS